MSTIKNAQTIANYLRADQRPACRTCAHVIEQPAQGGITVFDCKRGGFAVTAMAICAHHQRRQKAGQ